MLDGVPWHRMVDELVFQFRSIVSLPCGIKIQSSSSAKRTLPVMACSCACCTTSRVSRSQLPVGRYTSMTKRTGLTVKGRAALRAPDFFAATLFGRLTDSGFDIQICEYERVAVSRCAKNACWG